jgi:hypothetical protein
MAVTTFDDDAIGDETPRIDWGPIA